jgi:hypothetical protein
MLPLLVARKILLNVSDTFIRSDTDNTAASLTLAHSQRLLQSFI